MSVAGPPLHEVVAQAVSALQFQWYKPDEILKLSVKRITQSQIYDNLNQPIEGGLYDPALGPIEKHETCVTCSLPSKDCLGHMGHIQLSLPVYHPLLFDLLYKLVKAKCFVCHKFRCNRLKLKLVLTKLRLLDAGLLLLAKSVDDLALRSGAASGAGGDEEGGSRRRSMSAAVSKNKKKSSSSGGEGEGDEEDEDDAEPLEDQSDAVKNRLDELLAIAERNIAKYGRVAQQPDGAHDKKSKKGLGSKAAAQLTPGISREPTSHELTYRREIVSSFFKEIQSKKCASCGAFSPQLRRDGHTKIFRLPLTKQQQQSMDLLNLQFDDVLALTEDGFEKGSEAWQKLMRERNFYKEYQAILKKKKEEKRQEAQTKKKEKEAKREKKNKSTKATAEDDLDAAAEGAERDETATAVDSDVDTDSSSESGDSSEPESESSSEEESEGHKPLVSAVHRKHKKGANRPAPLPGNADEAAAAEGLDDRKPSAVQIQVLDDDAAQEGKRVPILMFPTEVEKHLELLWKQEADVLTSLWGNVSDLMTGESSDFSRPSATKNSDSNSDGWRMFFLRVLCVPPSRFRPPTRFGDMLVDHPQNVFFRHLLDLDTRIQRMQRGEDVREPTKKEKEERRAKAKAKSKKGKKNEADEEEEEEKSGEGESKGLDMNLLITTWITLQTEVNMLLDSTKGGQMNSNQVVSGIRQTFEKKEGLFRKNMMGKRVNFAARSVISPDPFLSTNEVGVPELFATQLSYPEPVTPFNVATLRQAVINGPKVHPGANFVEDERGNLIDLSQRSYAQRVALSKTLLTTGLYDSVRAKSAGGKGQVNAPLIGQKRVLRHVRNGDVMIMNRQPTLHKPSMMCHRVRVMKGKANKTQMKSAMWQTIRMHYANCNCYNADFDGDEMNLHVPQNELARAEAYHIANTDNQYVVPTDGSPLRGLIQDNVLTGVKLTMLDTFLAKDEYQQLLYSCLQLSPTLKLRTPVPAILKPAPLWSGKQIIKSVLDLLTNGRPPLNLTSKSKVPASSWAQHSEEGVVIIRNNELLCGVLDKNQFGDAGYGLVHAVYELYGGPTSGELMSTLGRLFTLYLQSQGHTCGIEDMMLVPRAEKHRAQLKKEAEEMGLKAACAWAEIEYDPSRPREINRVLQEKLKEDTDNGARLDGAMKSALNPFTSQIISACLPKGQVKPFPQNCMSLMTLSGAKGSSVNFSQISCLLGQQELEGRRVPMMATGKTLPSYRKYDPSPRAGGYVADRFLTGIRPQEYYHHCICEGTLVALADGTSMPIEKVMAGTMVWSYSRLDGGLIKRTVMQRLDQGIRHCIELSFADGRTLICTPDHRILTAGSKWIEAGDIAIGEEVATSMTEFDADAAALPIVSVALLSKHDVGERQVWDLSVAEADESDASFLAAGVIVHNCMAGREGLIDTAVKTSRSGYLQRCLIKHLESLVVAYDYTVRDSDGSVVQFQYGEDSVDVCKSAYLDRFSFLTTNYKALVHKLNPAAGLNKLDIHTADAYLNGEIQVGHRKIKKLSELDPVLSLFNPGRFLGSVSERYAASMSEYVEKDPDTMFKLDSGSGMTHDKFKALMKLHYINCLVNPGESVGVLAGQSIGEPSTQMTLNTFHLAGHGGANVTLGIPRLREIIMTASDRLKTPIMEVPLAAGLTKADAEKIASRLNRLALTTYLTSATCKESMMVHPGGTSVRLYTVRLGVLPMHHASVTSNGLTFADFQACFERQFCLRLNGAVSKQVKALSKGHAATPVVQKGGRAKSDISGESDEDGRGRVGAGVSELDAVSAGQARKHREQTSYDGPDDEDQDAIEEMERKEKERADANSDSEDEIDPERRKRFEQKSKEKEKTDTEETDTSSPMDVASFNVIQKCPFIRSVHYETTSKDECSLSVVVQVPLSIPKLLMMSMVEELLGDVLLRATPKIARSFVVEKFRLDSNGNSTGEKEVLIQTDGVNFPEIYKHQQLFDVTRISSNDIAAILRMYGVEAARTAIVREVTAVFKVYGISIDPRHLGLVADYMTFHGGFRPLNRAGIDANVSPFQKISFETSIGFLMNACMYGDKDFMTSPSARIVMGRPVGCGTGSFDLLNPLQF